MDIRKVGNFTDGTVYVTLPKGNFKKGDFVNVEILNNKELKLVLIEK